MWSKRERSEIRAVFEFEFDFDLNNNLNILFFLPLTLMQKKLGTSSEKLRFSCSTSSISKTHSEY